MRVRPAEPGEHALVAELTVCAYTATAGFRIEGGYADELRDVSGHAAQAEVLVAEACDGRLVGTVTFIEDAASPLAEHADHGAASLRFLAVDPAAQRTGVATALLGACVERARMARAQRLRLHVAAGNVGARRFYTHHGFARDPAADWTPVPGLDLLGYVRALS